MDAYGTHKEYIEKIIDVLGEINTAIEFGMGDYSTGILIKKVKKLISVEMQSEEWYNKIKKRYKDYDNWETHLSLGPNKYSTMTYPNKIDFTFVDGHGESRPEVINFFIDKNCPVIISHDTETPTYGWDRVKSKNYKRIDFKKHKNWTSLWTTNDNLFNIMKKYD